MTMPILDILDATGEIRWDAHFVLYAAMAVPDDEALRREYLASMKVDILAGGGFSFAGRRIELERTDFELARRFWQRRDAAELIDTRRRANQRVGQGFFVLAFLRAVKPEWASKKRVIFALDRIGQAKGWGAKQQEADWRRFRPVIHWCAAFARYRELFENWEPSKMDFNPDDGYTDLAKQIISIWAIFYTILELGEQFRTIALGTLNFPDPKHPDLWELPAGWWRSPFFRPVMPTIPALSDFQPSDEMRRIISTYTIYEPRLRRVAGPAKKQSGTQS